MAARPTLRPIALWLTLLAMVMATLAPSLARATAFAQGKASSWTEVCSATTVRSNSGSDTAPSGTQAAESIDCPYCLLTGDPFIPPAFDNGAHLRQDLSSAVPDAAGTLAHEPRAWTPLQARAPPRFF